MPPTYVYGCDICKHSSDHFFKLADRPEFVSCENCGGKSERQLTTSGILTHSYRDGYKRKGYQDLKEASKLNVAAARTDDQAEKKALKQEIGKTGHRFEKQ